MKTFEINGTYCLNKLRLPLYTFLVDDGNSTGRVVAYCFVCNEKSTQSERTASVVKQLITFYNGLQVKYIIVDKNFNYYSFSKYIICKENFSIVS